MPQYDNPPVTETVLGIEFRPLAAWQIPYFGLFWSRIRENYPRISVQPPLPEEAPGQPQVVFSMGPMPARCWFIDSNDQWLLQLQHSRFISNWRRQSDDDYPSYRRFRDRFESNFDTLQALLKDEKEFPELQLFQADVSYINQIDVGGDLGRLPEIFPVLSALKAGEFLPAPQAGGINFVYAMPDQRGRLFINSQPVINNQTGKEILQLSITAKTLIASNSKEAIMVALDLGHEWVVRGFTDFTSPMMHEVWKRTA